MATAIDTFDSFRTPNLFEASISADGGQVDSYFSDKMDVEKADCFDPDSWSLFPQPQDVDEPNNGFTMGGEEFSYPSIATPPPSAKEPPSNWPFQSTKQEAVCVANPLHQIDTTQPTANSRFDWGQPTPPDDQGSPGTHQFLATGSGSGDEMIKQEPDEEPSSKPVTASRRKKSADDQGEGSAKRRRSRKSMSAGGISNASDGPEAPADPVEEERRNRFLERNRVAASKCRQKKKEWTQNLENHARDLHSNNHQLQLLVTSLKDEVMYLRTEMLKHGSCDCTGIREYLAREADFLASGGGNSTGVRTPGSQRGSLFSAHGSSVGSPRHSVASATRTDDPLKQKLAPSDRSCSNPSPTAEG